jgi:PAS domain S-box-containing protein
MKEPVTARKSLKPLRQRAEQLMRATRAQILGMPDQQVRTLVYELQVHQIELEVQNEELRQAQIELAESRDRYSDLYEFAPVGYVTLDLKGRIIEANLAAATMFGVNRVDLIGKEIYEFVVRESRDQCYLHLRTAFASNTKQICELNLRRKDGTPLVVCLHSLTQQSELTRTELCRTALIDVTEARVTQRKLDELLLELEYRVTVQTADLQNRTAELAQQSAKLERRERQFRTLANNVPALFSYIDRDQRYRYVNHRYLKFWQRPATQIVGKTVAELFGPSAFADIRPHVEAALAGVESVYEVEIDRGDGRRVMQVRHVPDRDKKGQVRGFFTIETDITELKKTERALREREQRMSAILNTATDGIVTFNQQGIIADANPAVEYMFGYLHGKLLGQKIEVLMPHLAVTSVTTLDGYRKGGAPREVFRNEALGVRKDGSTFPVDFAVSKMEQLGLYTGIVRNITERKKDERELDLYRKNLQIMSSELLLIEERERQRLAHDLHDSLGQAVFQARMKLDRPPLNEEAIDELRSILDEIKTKVNSLTYELSPPVLREMGLGTALEWLIRNLKQRYDLLVRMKGHDSDIPLDEKIALVLFWSVREILINVAKHAQTNFATLAVQESDHSVKIVVKDLGKGFDTHDKSNTMGDGHFGLFSVRERLEYVGGSLKIRSATGKGTTVTLTVPCK